MTRLCCALLIPILFSLAGPSPASAADHLTVERPKLVVLVVVDQLRADYLSRFADDLLPAVDAEGRPGGFRYVIDSGAYWPRASHDVYQAMTCPGHASIITGAWPARSGIGLNQWWTGDSFQYCVGDDSARNLPDDGLGKDRPIGLANLKVPTLGDALAASTMGGAVVSVALKDRVAALLAGYRGDAALWFDGKAYRWTSSTFWMEALPPWVEELNRDPRIGEDVSTTAVGVDLTVDAALAAAVVHDMGADARPDLLGVGLSSLDYLGHEIGPYAPGVRDMVISMDRALARLYRGLSDRLGGLDGVVFAITSDHGIPPIPEEAADVGLPAGRIIESDLDRALEAHLVATLGDSPSGSWLGGIYRGNFWFDAAAMVDPALRLAAEEATREFVARQQGVLEVTTASDVAARRFPIGPAGRRLANQYRAGIMGDVVAGVAPFWFSTDYPAGVSHQTRYAYDTVVPLAISGPGVRPGRYATAATVIDLAPTLAWLLDILPPAAAEGRVLAEAIAQDAPLRHAPGREGSDQLGRHPRKRSRKGTP
jgi:arylsulfatase A-like enzyme